MSFAPFVPTAASWKTHNQRRTLITPFVRRGEQINVDQVESDEYICDFVI